MYTLLILVHYKVFFSGIDRATGNDSGGASDAQERRCEVEERWDRSQEEDRVASWKTK